MSNISQTQSGLQAGNLPASPGITHSDVVVNVFREFSSRTVPGASVPATTLPGSPELTGAGALPAVPVGPVDVPASTPALPAGGAVPLTPPPIQSGTDLQSAETTNAVTSQIPLSFEPFGSEVLKSLHEFGLGGSARSPALPPPFEVPKAPDYYFLPGA